VSVSDNDSKISVNENEETFYLGVYLLLSSVLSRLKSSTSICASPRDPGISMNQKGRTLQSSDFSCDFLVTFHLALQLLHQPFSRLSCRFWKSDTGKMGGGLLPLSRTALSLPIISPLSSILASRATESQHQIHHTPKDRRMDRGRTLGFISKLFLRFQFECTQLLYKFSISDAEGGDFL